ncbi:MAG: aspartyl/asparaginyl beta-hydroxylase domain-containing protein [Sphingosinicella sp.]
MALNAAEAERIARAGADALRAGNAAEAKRSFEQLTATGRANLQIWLLLAHSCRLAGDAAGAEKATDEVLLRDGHNVRALIFKGDCRREAGDPRAASSFYQTAARVAEQLGQLPPDLADELKRAETLTREIGQGYRRQLTGHLEKAGFCGSAPSARFRESIDILLDEKKVYFQQPTTYFFPRLPQIQFYERDEFSWAERVEAATDDIRTELQKALDDDVPFKPYFQSRADRPRYDFHGLLDNPAWSTLYLFENGGWVEDNAKRFPRTIAALEVVPMPHITIRAPSILFSCLQPGARIAPHNGMINTRLICHLPLIVPKDCGFRVGNEVRQWQPGRLLVFDDTIEHEAWNDSAEDRILLIFDVWRPELTLEERRAVTAIFGAIDGSEISRP